MTVRWIIVGSINNGDTASFADIAERMSKTVREQEPGALAYDWFATPDGSTFVIEEAYTDDAAFALHMENVQPLLPEFMGVVSIEKILVLTPVSDGVREALGGFGALFTDEVQILKG